MVNNEKNTNNTLNDGYEYSSEPQNNTQNIQQDVNAPKTVTLSILVLCVTLSVTVVLLVVFAFLYFGSLTADKQTQETTQLSTVMVMQAETETQEPTQEPTKKSTSSKKKKTPSKTEQFDSYLITLYPSTQIFAGPGYEYEYVMSLDEQGVFTIVDECYNTNTNSIWGKLKSGVGWVNTAPNSNYYDTDTNIQSQDNTPYLVSLETNTKIYAGPGYGYECVMLLDESGVFTIVEESYDYSSYSTWGKLKSGVGWVNLG